MLPELRSREAASPSLNVNVFLARAPPTSPFTWTIVYPLLLQVGSCGLPPVLTASGWGAEMAWAPLCPCTVPSHLRPRPTHRAAPPKSTCQSQCFRLALLGRVAPGIESRPTDVWGGRARDLPAPKPQAYHWDFLLEKRIPWGAVAPNPPAVTFSEARTGISGPVYKSWGSSDGKVHRAVLWSRKIRNQSITKCKDSKTLKMDLWGQN